MLKYILACIPLLGTSIGAFTATFHNRLEEKEDTLVAVATGILSAITFNLFTEALGNIRYSLFVGIAVGFLFMWVMNSIAHQKNLTTRSKVFWGMLIHNIPEGIVIGTSLASKNILPATISIIIGIAIQNIPDGMVVSASLVSTRGKAKAILIGILSGIVEPVATIAIIIAAGKFVHIQRVEAFLIGFSLSAILVIAWELLKECKEKKIVLVIAIATIVFTSISGGIFGG